MYFKIQKEQPYNALIRVNISAYKRQVAAKSEIAMEEVLRISRVINKRLHTNKVIRGAV